MAEIVLDEEKAKDLMREVLVEMLQDKHSAFYALLLEAMEDAALGRAIREGRQESYVAKEEIRSLLEA